MFRRVLRARALFASSLLASAALWGLTPAQAQALPEPAAVALDPEALALSNQIIDLSFPPETRQAMLVRSVDTMMAQVRTGAFEAVGDAPDPAVQQILDRFQERALRAAERIIAESSPTLFVALARAYVRQFSRDELLEIRAFVATPTGAKYVQRSMDLLSDPDFAQANTAYMARVFAVLQPLQNEFREELLEYLQQRQSSAPRDS